MLSAQDATSTAAAPTILEHLRLTGRISIAQDGRLATLLAPSTDGHRTIKTLQGDSIDCLVSTGYRIRVFSGNNQQESKRQAQEIADEIAALYPDLITYVVFRTPNWRLTVGNFRTAEEAYAMLHELKGSFPTWGREMFIVADEIELPMEAPQRAADTEP